MGMGDEIIVTGEARILQEKDPKHRKVRIIDKNGNPRRWFGVWDGNPRLARLDEQGDFIKLSNAPYRRPYIDWDRMAIEFNEVYPNRLFRTKNVRDPRLPWRFTDHKVNRGELYLDRLPRRDYVVIEPHVKTIQPNRDWGWNKWQTVVDAIDVDWVQVNPTGFSLLRNVRHMPGNNQVEACKVMSGARLYVGPEGGLYHAAAAWGIPSVAVFGGYVSPANQGYDDCINLYEPMDGQSPCGQRVPCQHCREALNRITPEMVVESIKHILDI